MLSPEDLEAIRGRAEAATEGPWSVDEISGDIDDYGDALNVISRGVDGPHGVGLNTGEEYQMYSVADATFIAHARTDVPKLLEEVGRLRCLLAEWGDAYTELG
jgi:hypothetical protein